MRVCVCVACGAGGETGVVGASAWGGGKFLGSHVVNQVLTIRLVQWLSWVFAPQERKKERENERMDEVSGVARWKRKNSRVSWL